MKKFLNLGFQPLANSYIKKKNIKVKEKKFKLVVCFNPKNYFVSILNTVPKEKMFNKNYPYKSSESNTMKKSFGDNSATKQTHPLKNYNKNNVGTGLFGMYFYYN